MRLYDIGQYCFCFKQIIAIPNAKHHIDSSDPFMGNVLITSPNFAIGHNNDLVIERTNRGIDQTHVAHFAIHTSRMHKIPTSNGR